ncbi:integrin beta-1-binding protein 1 isoform X2 [Dendropsophus ebraccatus]|uniref:integrin beta-1-binding protein 1 isoform X2 n=1 Tax=Dendropsophus ebraccatus TaxID=150705 RepID=UPI0038311B3F
MREGVLKGTSGWNGEKRMFRKVKKRHSSSSSQSSEISTKSKSVDSSLGGLSRSSTVASLDTDSAKSVGQVSNNSEPCAEFRVKYVGSIERVKPEESKALHGSLDLINYIDVAQQDGKLPFVPSDEDFIMVVSKYGIKVTTLDQYDVLHRHPLYLIVSMVCYDDGLVAGKSLLALKTKDACEDQCSLWVYQCANLEHAQSICKVLSTAFDSVLTEKTRVPAE